jgi:hypothetical protein
MAEQHRATADEWTAVKALASGGVAYSCILELLHRVEALEAKDEDDKEAWAARLRRPGRSQGERIASLVKRIEALEATQRAHVDLSHLSDAEREKILKQLANPDRFEVLEVAQPAKSNYPEIPDSSLLSQVAAVIDNGTACDTDPRLIAAYVIHEVADLLRKESSVHFDGLYWAQRLEREAER